MDTYLSKEGLIDDGDYLALVHDDSFVIGLKSDFEWLSLIPSGKGLE